MEANAYIICEPCENCVHRGVCKYKGALKTVLETVDKSVPATEFGEVVEITVKCRNYMAITSDMVLRGMMANEK